MRIFKFLLVLSGFIETQRPGERFYKNQNCSIADYVEKSENIFEEKSIWVKNKKEARSFYHEVLNEILIVTEGNSAFQARCPAKFQTLHCSMLIGLPDRELTPEFISISSPARIRCFKIEETYALYFHHMRQCGSDFKDHMEDLFIKLEDASFNFKKPGQKCNYIKNYAVKPTGPPVKIPVLEFQPSDEFSPIQLSAEFHATFDTSADDTLREHNFEIITNSIQKSRDQFNKQDDGGWSKTRHEYLNHPYFLALDVNTIAPPTGEPLVRSQRVRTLLRDDICHTLMVGNNWEYTKDIININTRAYLRCPEKIYKNICRCKVEGVAKMKIMKECHWELKDTQKCLTAIGEPLPHRGYPMILFEKKEMNRQKKMKKIEMNGYTDHEEQKNIITEHLTSFKRIRSGRMDNVCHSLPNPDWKYTKDILHIKTRAYLTCPERIYKNMCLCDIEGKGKSKAFKNCHWSNSETQHCLTSGINRSLREYPQKLMTKKEAKRVQEMTKLQHFAPDELSEGLKF